MSHLLHHIEWKMKDEQVDHLLLGTNALILSPMASGLEAEVMKIDSDKNSYVLKVWNRESKPDIGMQYHMLHALHNAGMSVSKPHGWGVNASEHQVLLTSFDGNPVRKLNKAILSKLAKLLIQVHQYPIEKFNSSPPPRYDFVGYFFPSIDDHPDIQTLLQQLVELAQIRYNSIIHGDYNLGNILEYERTYTIIDWTNIQLGDARYDIAWSAILMNIYVGERYSSMYLTAFQSEFPQTDDELAIFEAIACLRWVLLNRIVNLPMDRNTLSRVKDIMNANPYLSEEQIGLTGGINP